MSCFVSNLASTCSRRFFLFLLIDGKKMLRGIGKDAMVRSAQAVLHHVSASTAAGGGADAWGRLQCRPFHGSARALGIFNALKNQVCLCPM
jgi:hypothetical protein